MNTSLFRSAGVYSLTNILNQAIPMLMLPIMTRYLSNTEYGIVSMYGILVNIVAPFTGLSIHGAISRQYYEGEKIDISVYIYNCILLLLGSTSVIAVLFWIFSAPISKLSHFPEGWLWTIIVASFCQFLIQVLLVVFQVQVKPFAYGAFQILRTLLNVGISLWLVVGLHYHWQGRVTAQIISLLLFAAIAVFYLYWSKWINPKFNIAYIKHAASFGIPIIPHAMGGIINSFLDRIFLTNLIGLSATGVYTVGLQISMVIRLIQTSFNNAWVPWLYSKLKLNDFSIKRKIVKFTYLYFGLLLFLSLLLSVTAPMYLTILVGDKFAGASQYILWLTLGYSFNGMYKMVTNYIFYAQKTRFLPLSTFFAACINVVMNYVLIKMNGSVGAAQATCLAFFLSFIFTWILSSRIYKMPWSLRKSPMA